MRMYKIYFDNNKAIAAEQVDNSYKVGMKIDWKGGKSHIEWMVIFANDENDGLQTGNKIIDGMHTQKRGVH